MPQQLKLLRESGRKNSAPLSFDTEGSGKLVLPGAELTGFGLYSEAEKYYALKVFKSVDRTYRNFGAKQGGFNVLNIPDDMYKDADQFWNEINKPWLDEAIKRGDDIVLATEPEGKYLSYVDRITGEEVITGFGHEYNYLIKRGYVYDAATNMMKKR